MCRTHGECKCSPMNVELFLAYHKFTVTGYETTTLKSFEIVNRIHQLELKNQLICKVFFVVQLFFRFAEPTSTGIWFFLPIGTLLTINAWMFGGTIMQIRKLDPGRINSGSDYQRRERMERLEGLESILPNLFFFVNEEFFRFSLLS